MSKIDHYARVWTAAVAGFAAGRDGYNATLVDNSVRHADGVLAKFKERFDENGRER